jgi:hypothetical protein
MLTALHRLFRVTPLLFKFFVFLLVYAHSECAFAQQSNGVHATPRATPLPHHSTKHAIWQTPGPLGPAVNGIAVALEPEIAPYRLGGQTLIAFHFLNTTRKPVYFHSRTEFHFEVSGPGPGAVRAHSFQEQDFGSLGRFDRDVRVPIGSSEPWADDLRETYELLEPGAYQVRAVITIHNTHAVVTSPWITVTVLPKN